MPETDRLDKLETAVRNTQDSMLLIGKDVHQMNLSISSMAHSLELLAEVKQDVRLMEERSEQRYYQLVNADKTIHKRLDSFELIKKDISEKPDNGDRAYQILVQIAKWLGGSVATLLVGLLVFLISLKG